MSPAFVSVRNAPLFFIVLRPFAETTIVTFLPSSGMKRVFFWRFTWRRRLPVGLNFVARTRLEYPPPTILVLPVIAHSFAIFFPHDLLCLPRSQTEGLYFGVAYSSHTVAHGSIARTLMQLIDSFFLVAVIMFSAVIHEVMHGVAANKLGDPTARLLGRLTLNPLKHIDMFGSIILPLVFALTNSPILFGWAKPVPYNPYNLRPGRFSEAIVAAAGPFSNLAIAAVGGFVIRSGILPAGWSDIIFIIVLVNTMLCVFNLLPVPPLDGSKVLSALLPRSLAMGYDQWRARMEHNPFMGMGIVLVIILLLGDAFGGLVYGLAHLLAGI